MQVVPIRAPGPAVAAAPDNPIRQKAMAGLGKLPPFSAVMNKLMTTLADEDVSFGEVAGVIEQDAVLSGNVLRVVNSAAYGRRGTVNSLRHAVSMLGLAKIRNIAMSLSVSQMWGRLDLHPQWSPKQFHLHASAVAVMADQCALEIEVNYPEGGFTAGLLSGVGLLLIATALRQEYSQLNRCYGLGQEAHQSLEACERALFGFVHTDLSADLLRHWDLPVPIVEAVSDAGNCLPGAAPLHKLSELLVTAQAAAAQAGFPIQSWVLPPVGPPQGTLDQAGLGARSDAIMSVFETQMHALRPFAA
jgi:HD-like signal output (HDOD) protein